MNIFLNAGVVAVTIKLSRQIEEEISEIQYIM